MESPAKPASRIPRIVVLIGHLRLAKPPSRLALEVQNVLPAYSGIVDIRVVDKPISETLQYAQELERAGKADIFICTGATGDYLRKRLATPVVLMPVADYDILHALERARRIGDKIAVLGYGGISLKLEEVQSLFTVMLRQGTYATLAEAEALVKQVAAEGCKVVVGSSMVTELAEEAGLTGILVTSSNAVRQGLDDAMVILRSARAEASKRQRLNTLLQHLSDGVIAVDMDGRVQSINPVLAQLLDVSVEWAQGRNISELDPQLELARVLRTGTPDQNRILRLGTRTVLANAVPIFEDGAQTGAVLSCQDTSAVQRADRQIRTSGRATRFVAKYRLSQLIGDSAAMRELVQLAERYALTDSTVLINGESGTGKELLAQGIHNASPRRKNPFVAINCAAFPDTLLESELVGYEEGAVSGSRKGGKPGLFEMAHTGTIFLDEIGDMPLSLQTRLLRVLQEREVVRLGGTEPTPVDVRIVAATHHKLRARIAEHTFREDLYYRLNILRLKLPPLRDRMEDMPALAAHILGQVVKRTGAPDISERLLQALLPYLESYSWPGNIRELENVLERTVLSMNGEGEKKLDAPHLRKLIAGIFEDEEIAVPVKNGEEVSLKALAKSTELVRIHKVMQECGGNLERASKRLGISRSTIWRRLNSGG
ncbi:propionate catabolism operon regulatory protein PrpR [soil metagenome]